MINFYSYSENCHQLSFGDITIYYSFKTPMAYRTKMQGLRVRKDMIEGLWGSKVAEHAEAVVLGKGKGYLLSDRQAFLDNLDYEIKRNFLETARKIALERFKIC